MKRTSVLITSVFTATEQHMPLPHFIQAAIISVAKRSERGFRAFTSPLMSLSSCLIQWCRGGSVFNLLTGAQSRTDYRNRLEPITYIRSRERSR